MTRIISIMLASLFSLFLFALMNLLIDSDAKAIEPGEQKGVYIVDFKPSDLTPENKSRIKPKLPKRQEPVKEPKISQNREQTSRAKPIRIASIKPTLEFTNQSDSFIETNSISQSIYGGGLDKAPSIRVEPHYPMKARYKGIEGSVTLQFDINELGETTNIVVVESNPKGVFEKASKKALKKWRYKKSESEESVAAKNQIVTLSFNMQE
ncbi:TonB family protein [Aliikangiella marina]|nr:TonB family protein [Aliikangiella marina]